MFKNVPKGEYGHSKSYMKRRLLMTLICLLIIVVLVVLSIIIFHTRKSWLVILACVAAIPFARNLIDFAMALRAKPLSENDHAKFEELHESVPNSTFLYDITVTDTDGMIYIPCVAVYNNNIIAYVPDNITDRKKVKIPENKAVKFLELAKKDGLNPRICVVRTYDKMKKEFDKLSAPKEEQLKEDERIAFSVITLGF